jgi:non-heme chloroperoxidase
VPYIEVEKGIRIFVEDINPSAPRTILFIHGWPANHNMFEYQFNVLPAHGFRCIGMDIRGFGKSSRPWIAYSYNRLADDVCAVMKALKLRDITLLGFSVGGAIAVKYMARHFGHGVAKLVLASAAVPLFTKRPDYPYGLPVTDVNNIIAQTYTDRPKMIKEFGKKFFASNAGPAFMNWFGGLALEASGHATSSVLESLRDEDLRKDLPWITVPTWILHGVHDQIVPFPSAEVTHKCIRCSALIPFEYSGHGLFYDELEKFNSCLLEILD